MSGIETPKIEPTLILKDAPSIAAGEETPKLEDVTPASAEPAISAPKAEIIEAKAEVASIEAPKPDTPKPEAAKFEAPGLPPAPQLGIIPFESPPPSAEESAPRESGRSTRFALLAASVAIAASFGAIAGSLGVAKFGPAFTDAPPPVASVAKEQVADEVKALKETVAQLRATTKTLSDNFAALKTSVANSGAQNTKIAETLERLERGQADLKKTQAAPETTGSVQQAKQTPPAALGAPPTTLKHPIVQDWVLRRVYDGAALIEGRDGIIEVEPGIVAPGLGRIESIKRQDGRWVVVTSRGLVVGR